MNEAWQHVAVLDAEVIVRAEHVGGDDGRVAAPVLLEVTPGEGLGTVVIYVGAQLTQHGSE